MSAVEELDAIVIGAGVVGLAVARALARAGREVVVLESLDAIGQVTSARNSEVIHAGLYYPTGSLKAQLCVAGKRLLYGYCAERGVAFRRCGKLVVAAQAQQVGALQQLARQAQANGVDDVQLLTGAQAERMEPALAAHAALWSPSTGIVDSHALMLALLGEAQDHGAMLALKSPVQRGEVTPQGIVLDVGGEQPMRVRARSVVNAAGLSACEVARSIDGLDAAWVPRARRCKGSYFSLAGTSPFSRLVYPVPDEAGGLGVHLTLDLGGQARFGPDVQWLADDGPIDYAVDARRGEAFYAAIRRYWPALPDGALLPAYSGVRPKIGGSGEAADFTIQGPAVHGVVGLVNLFGIESPGLTAALAIGELVGSSL
jgi:L-2-hydroxyglutarate oxidase LhgO